MPQLLRVNEIDATMSLPSSAFWALARVVLTWQPFGTRDDGENGSHHHHISSLPLRMPRAFRSVLFCE